MWTAGDLRGRLGRPINPCEVARIALQFCSGMIFLFESAGIIHRDIKPANILLTHDGTVKITDFGLARAFSGPRDRTTGSGETAEARTDAGFVTQCGKIMGSLPWMSPEQFTAPNAVTVASDVYSFGVVLYQMLTGRMPFTASNSEDWIKKILHETPTPPVSTSGADDEASSIVMKCLEKKAEHRFQDFVELRQALQHWAITKGWSCVIPAVVTRSEVESAMTAADWAGRGYALGQIGRNEDSYRSYLAVLDLDPTYPGIHTNLGTSLIRLRRIEEGLRHYRMETEFHPNMALAWDTLGLGYLQCERLAEALDASRRASELAPGHLGIARHYAFAAQRAEAVQDHQRAVAAVKVLLDHPTCDNPRTAVTEAILFMQAGDIQTGLELHNRSVDKYPSAATAWYNFGVTLHIQGQIMSNVPGPYGVLLDKAVGCYSRAIALDKRSTWAKVYRGAIYARRGDNELARSDWQAAIANDSNHAGSQLVQILLQFNFTPVLKEWLDKLDSPTALQYLI